MNAHIESLAREAFSDVCDIWTNKQGIFIVTEECTVITDNIEAFAKAVAENCAKVVQGAIGSGRAELADLIRERYK
jgi:hypothetical protein